MPDIRIFFSVWNVLPIYDSDGAAPPEKEPQTMQLGRPGAMQLVLAQRKQRH